MFSIYGLENIANHPLDHSHMAQSVHQLSHTILLPEQFDSHASATHPLANPLTGH
jgi:hypothetical protein